MRAVEDVKVMVVVTEVEVVGGAVEAVVVVTEEARAGRPRAASACAAHHAISCCASLTAVSSCGIRVASS